MRRGQIAAAALAVALLVPAVGQKFIAEAHAAAPLLKEVEDFAAEGAAAQQRGLPILVMFASEHCSYCKRVEEEFLKPMLISGDYDDKAIIRKLVISNPFAEIRDFDGRRVELGEVSARYNIRVTPTVVMLDGCGRVLTQSIVGITTPDFYGGYLDEAIAEAGNRIRERGTLLAARDEEATGAPRCAVGGAAPAGGAG